MTSEAETRMEIPNQARSLRRQKADLRVNPGIDMEWGFYNSPILGYDATFRPVLEGRRIVDLVADKSNPVVMDLMAPTGTLRDLFGQLPPTASPRGVALSLGDLRDNQTKAEDTTLNITQVTGSITDSSTWKELDKALDGRKVDLAMARPLGGLRLLPRHPAFYALTAQRIWKMLAMDGAMLVQTPREFPYHGRPVDIQAWVDILKQSGIEAKLGAWNSVLFIKRTAESPSRLPFPVDQILGASFQGLLQDYYKAHTPVFGDLPGRNITDTKKYPEAKFRKKESLLSFMGKNNLHKDISRPNK
jgi:hypothetical protein